MARWMKLPLGRKVGLDPGHIVLDGDTTPSPKKEAEPPIFGPCLLWPNRCMDQDATWYGARLRPRPHYDRWGPSCPPKRRSPQFSVHVCCGQTAGWIKMPLGTMVGLDLGNIVLDADRAPPPKGHSHPQISDHVCCGQTAR